MGSQVLTGRATRWDMDMVELRITATATLTYLHGDNLGSVSLTTNAAGQKLSEQRYKPYGEVRWSSGAGMPTDFTFTGQRAGPANYVGSLTDYVARFYSPALGRFVSADTIVPGAGNSQALNRYMYVLGRVLNLGDPTGHCAGDADDASNQDAACWTAFKQASSWLGYKPSGLDGWNLADLSNLVAWMARGVTFAGDQWSANNLRMAIGTFEITTNNLFGRSTFRFMTAVGGWLNITKHRVSSDSEVHADAAINLWMPDETSDTVRIMSYLAHEIGHKVDHHGGGLSGGGDWLGVTGAMLREYWKYENGGYTKHEMIAPTDLQVAQFPRSPSVTGEPYATWNNLEDFASTFAYMALSGAYADGPPSPARQAALTRLLR